MRRTTASLLAAALLLAGGSPAAEAAKTCKPLFKSNVHGDYVQATARTAATAAWSAGVAIKHTPKFANWSNAEGRKTPCSVQTALTGLNYYRCTAEGRPCAHE